jgi:hypothetical protein
MGLSETIEKYRQARSFGTADAVHEFLSEQRVYSRPKRIYFDEVENANVWSFYLVDRDLHHTFEEYLLDRHLPAYAGWSRHQYILDPAIERATFPISETATRYFPPVPEAGDVVHYALEVLDVNDTSAVFGFVGFCECAGQLAERASVLALWLRVFVKYVGLKRSPAPMPSTLAGVLRSDMEAKWGFLR